jgi:hypothetical protein
VTRSYAPFVPARRPGGRPPERPRYRVLVQRSFAKDWDALPTRVGVRSAQEFYDHLSVSPGRPPDINRTTVLRGRAGRPVLPGYSRTIHYEISGAGRIDYQFADEFRSGRIGDARGVVLILTIDPGGH